MNEPTPKADAEPGPERGLRCRHCGGVLFYQVWTRPKPGGKIVRRKLCRHCGHRITTTERVTG